MNKDQVNGRLQEAHGYVSEFIGQVFNRPDMQMRGQMKKVYGKAKTRFGDAKARVSIGRRAAQIVI